MPISARVTHFTKCMYMVTLLILTDHFSGPSRALGRVCVSACVRTITFELNDLGPTYLAR